MFLGNDPSLRWEKSRLQKVDLLIYSFSKYRGHIKYQAVGWGQRVNKMNWSPFPERARCIRTQACCCSVATSCFHSLVTPLTSACQASLSFTISQSLLKLMSTESVMPSNHCILSCLLLLLPFSASGSFPMSWLFTSGGQSIGALASASVLPMNI